MANDEYSTDPARVPPFSHPKALLAALQGWAQIKVPADQRQRAWLVRAAAPVKPSKRAQERHRQAIKLAEKTLKAYEEAAKFIQSIDLAEKAKKKAAPSVEKPEAESVYEGAVVPLRSFVVDAHALTSFLTAAIDAPEAGSWQKWQALVNGLGDPMWLSKGSQWHFAGRFKSIDELAAIAVHVGLFDENAACTVIENAPYGAATEARARNFITTQINQRVCAVLGIKSLRGIEGP